MYIFIFKRDIITIYMREKIYGFYDDVYFYFQKNFLSSKQALKGLRSIRVIVIGNYM